MRDFNFLTLWFFVVHNTDTFRPPLLAFALSVVINWKKSDSRCRATMELSPHPNHIRVRSLHMIVPWQLSIPIVKDVLMSEVVFRDVRNWFFQKPPLKLINLCLRWITDEDLEDRSRISDEDLESSHTLGGGGEVDTLKRLTRRKDERFDSVSLRVWCVSGRRDLCVSVKFCIITEKSRGKEREEMRWCRCLWRTQRWSCLLLIHKSKGK